MDSDLKIKKQVSTDQLNALLEFLQAHQQLAKGLTRGRRAKFNTLKLWNVCAKKLNEIRDGAFKDGKGWSKYWCDMKYRVRRRALEQKAAKECNGLNTEGSNWSPTEEVVLSLIGEASLENVVIKSDLLHDEDSIAPDTKEPTEDNDSNLDIALSSTFDTSSINIINEAATGSECCSYREESERNSAKEPERKSSYIYTKNILYPRPYNIATSEHEQPRLTRSSKRRRLSRDFNNFDDRSELSGQYEKKPRISSFENCNDADCGDAKEFIRLEKEKLEKIERVNDSLQTIATEITRLSDVMTHIRDVLINNWANR